MDTTRLLKRALARTGQTAIAFAQSVGKGYSASMLYAVARGDRHSDALGPAIDALIAPEVEADRAAASLAVAA